MVGSLKEPGRILMLGSAEDVRGGVSAAVRVYRKAGLFERWPVRYIATHCDGTKRDKALRAARAWAEYARELARGGVALVHVHINSDASFWRKALFVVPAWALRIPYVLHVHCGDFARFHAQRCGPRAQAFVRALFARAAGVVALSQQGGRELAHAVGRQDLAVIPNPVAIPAHAAAIPHAPPVALFLGMLREAKGTYDLLRAWREVLFRVPTARLVLAGGGDIERARTMAGELGIAHAVETPGWIDGAIKRGLLERASVFVLPSHHEAMPMALLEAMAAGLPSVCTRVGGIPEVVEEGGTALLVAPRDIAGLAGALGDLLSAPDRCRAMGTAARERAMLHYSARTVLPRIEALWQRVLGDPRPSAAIGVSKSPPRQPRARQPLDAT